MGFSREHVDEIAVDSQSRWGDAARDGKYDEQVVPVETELESETIVVREDEHPRPDTTRADLVELPLAFRDEGDGVLHPSNSSGIVDGSATTLVASEAACEEYEWEPLARIVDSTVVGGDPTTMLTVRFPRRGSYSTGTE